MREHQWRKVAIRTSVALVIVLATACGGGDPADDPATGGTPMPTLASEGPPATDPAGTDLAGPWAGTWESTTSPGATGTFLIEFTQTGNLLSGTITVNDTPCLTEGTISGALTGNQIAFGAVEAEQEVAYAGTVQGDTMSGTYSAPACDQGAGTWEASRAS